MWHESVPTPMHRRGVGRGQEEKDTSLEKLIADQVPNEEMKHVFNGKRDHIYIVRVEI